MSKQKGTSVRQRRVSAELRALRVKRQLTCRDVALGVDFSESKISRMETGDRGLYADDVAAILGFLRAPSGLRQELMALVREGEERNWHEIHGKLPPNWKDLIRIEDEATAIKNFEPLLIPGLAQVPEYSRALLHAVKPELTESELETLISAQLSRQLVLSRHNAPTVHLIIEEMVLRRVVGNPDVMRAQLRNLQTMTNRSNVTIQIIPFAAGGHIGLTGPFVLLDFADNPTLAYVESYGTSSFIEEESGVARAKVAWSSLRAIALSREESARQLAKLIGELHPPEEPRR
ncbi:helix-turn-helix transcriptional regulator [Amycolatopsis sp. FDAARGOS 1241]|uniref:helix-turn-helix domain-containing protein n=1 Tax=Amycolatopsis sp. FDAARGOS 1241 TaxID=2778070 RepID=UPI00194E3001|nr:helix-turn-helix transcriptional regulator [Amycolatopsis sp. FDAARGOS 1241]QRP45225.1 helix-turn-helix domain-containing protein [Amycolatopsis sp. FDAARGOS 1241]